MADIWVGFLVLLAFLYRNNLPFAYHVRFLWHVSLAWFCGRRPPHVLAASEKTFRVWPDDIDFNWHMNNSSCASRTVDGAAQVVAVARAPTYSNTIV